MDLDTLLLIIDRETAWEIQNFYAFLMVYYKDSLGLWVRKRPHISKGK